jgi:hypothetical protein
MGQSGDLVSHYRTITSALIAGRVVPFLGAGVNMCGRPEAAEWKAGESPFLPNGGELARHLAGSFGCPSSESQDLLRATQYIAVTYGYGPLYEELHRLFDGDYPSTDLHRFLAELPSMLRQAGHPPRYQLLVTTNYDDLLERAFRQAGEPFDLVVYVAEGEQRGKFKHWPPDGEPVLIEKPNEYGGLSLDKRPVILKIHGAVDRVNSERDSFVITEDHYIDYLTRTDLSNLVPAVLAAKLRRSHFLFLGYSLRDWNLRVIFHRIWGEQRLSFNSWAIQLNPSELDEKFWRRRDVEILDLRLEEYVEALRQMLPGRNSGAAVK